MDDGFASYTIGIAALREISVRKGEVPPVNGTEDRWLLEGPVNHPRDLETVRDWLSGDGEKTPPAETLSVEKGSEEWR